MHKEDKENKKERRDCYLFLTPFARPKKYLCNNFTFWREKGLTFGKDNKRINLLIPEDSKGFAKKRYLFSDVSYARSFFPSFPFYVVAYAKPSFAYFLRSLPFSLFPCLEGRDTTKGYSLEGRLLLLVKGH